MKWISQLLDRVQSNGRLKGFPCIVRMIQDNIRMEVLERQLPCGHARYAVTLDLRMEGKDEWLPMTLIMDIDLPAAINLLQRAQACIENLDRN